MNTVPEAEAEAEGEPFNNVFLPVSNLGNRVTQYFFLQSGWNRRNHPNVKFIWFEDMKKNQREIIEESADFLGFHLTTKQVRCINTGIS